MEYIIVKSESDIYRLKLKNIIYIKKIKNMNKLIIKTSNLTITTKGILKNLIKTTNNKFIQIDRNVIVNKDYIFKINTSIYDLSIQLITNEKINASKRGIKCLLMEWNELSLNT